MLALARRHPWLATLASVGAFLATAFLVSLFVPYVADVCGKDEYTGAKECAAHHLGPFALLSIIGVIDQHNGFVTALGTLAVAAFTLTLWRTSDKQAILTRESIDLARSQFSATFPPDIRIIRVETLSITPVPDAAGLITTVGGPVELWAKLKFANAGKTDAIVREICWLLDTKAPDYPEFPTTDLKDTILCAGSEGSQSISLIVGNKYGNFDEMTFHLTGYLSYRDLANKWHKTGFSWRTGHDALTWIPVANSSFNYSY